MGYFELAITSLTPTESDKIEEAKPAEVKLTRDEETELTAE